VLFSNGSTIAQDNANFFWDDTNNRFGIGTATPSFSLDVVKAGANAIRAYNSDSGSVDAYFIAQNTTTAALFGTNNVGPYLYTASALDMQFYTSAIERMRIFSDGNILIGSSLTNAGYKLDVSGTGRFTGALTGTSASFSSVVLAGGATNIDSSLAVQVSSAGTGTQKWIGINKNNSYGLIIGYNEIAGGLSGVGAYIRQITSDPMFFVVSNSITALTLAPTGAATFAGSVTALNYYGTDNANLIAENTNTNGTVLTLNSKGTVGIIKLQTNSTDRLTLSASGNLGLGVTPSAWDSGQKVYQSGLGSFYGLADGGATILVNNGYYNSGWKYSSNGSAANYQIVQNAHQWLTAPSGTAGNAISFTQAMTLGANGALTINSSYFVPLVINTTYGQGGLEFQLAGTGFGGVGSANNFTSDAGILATDIGMGTNGSSTNRIVFATGAGYSTRMIIGSGGNVLVGTTTDAGYKLDVNGTLRAVGTINSNQGYTYPNGIINVTGGSASWIFLGTISIAQGGNTAVITLEGGSGYNADEGQNGSARIFIRTSNGSPNGSGFYFSATLTQMGYNTGVVSSCIMTQTNATTYNVYVNFGAYSGNTYYKVEGSAFTWTASNTDFGATAPTGGQTLTNVFKVISNSTFGGTVVVSSSVTAGNVFNSFSGTNAGFELGNSGSAGQFGFLKWDNASNYLYLGHSYGGAFNRNLVITSGGNVGIGMSNPQSKFVLQSTTNYETSVLGSATANTYTLLASNGLYGMTMGVGNSGNTWFQSQRVDGGTSAYNLLFNPNGGNVLINRITDGGYTFDVNGTGRFTGQITGTDALFTGSVTAAGGFFDTSDSRLKILVKDYEQPKGIENVAARMYVKNSKQELGYYAQDLQEILPSAVVEGSDGFLTLSYSQVHTAKIAHLEKEVAELKELIKSLIK
jgi:hypothetical protein